MVFAFNLSMCLVRFSAVLLVALQDYSKSAVALLSSSVGFLWMGSTPFSSDSALGSSTRSTGCPFTRVIIGLCKVQFMSVFRWDIDSLVEEFVSLTLLWVILVCLSVFSNMSTAPSVVPSAWPLVTIVKIFESYRVLLVDSLFSLSGTAFSSTYTFDLEHVSSGS